MNRRGSTFAVATSLVFALALYACGGGGGGGSESGSSRSFLMGSTPFFASSTAFPDFRFENMDDRDLLSLHVDDFWGVPWIQCLDGTCTDSDLPAAWVNQWKNLAENAHASGKTIYLAVSPLGNRRTLAKRVLADGTYQENWAPADSNGCYKFVEDAANAATYQTAYIAYVKYLVNLVKPAYLSPAVEMNIPFTECAAQKSAWIAWYTGVQNALKAEYPSLVIFPTFQMESMYGIANAQAACTSGTVSECFGTRLTEALAIPADRMAFSTYPSGWKFSPAFNYSYPTDTFARTKAATTRKIWVSETGWPAVPVRTSYQHGASGSCAATYAMPDAIANDSEQAKYIDWLLNEAQNQRLEAVVWWLNRDYLDGTVAAKCPCDPATGDTCRLADLFYSLGSDYGEFALRIFGNMALFNYDDSPRPGYATWKRFRSRPYTP
jgi:hypothetical protein